MPISLGRVAFEEHSTFVGHHTHDGRKIPTWDNLTPKIRDAWEAAATAAVRADQKD